MGNSQEPTSIISLDCKVLGSSPIFPPLLESAGWEFFEGKVDGEKYRTNLVESAQHPNCIFTKLSKRGAQNLELVSVQKTPFDTEVLGFPCAKVTTMAMMAPDVSYDEHLALYSEIVRSTVEAGYEYLVARVISGHWRRIHALEQASFRLVDGISLFSHPLKDLDLSSDLKSIKCKIYEARNTADEYVAKLAREAFTRSRFHNDNLVTAESAAKIHEQWALNCLHKKVADALLVAESDAGLVGFVTLRLNRKPIEKGRSCTAIIDLIAVAPQISGQGIGRGLVLSALNWAKINGADHLDVQTQTDNLGAQALYARCGFKITNQFFTLRWSSRSSR